MFTRIKVGRKQLDSNELQVLGMLAKEHGYDDLYLKCCTMMFQNLRLVGSQEVIYGRLHATYLKGALDRGATTDQANRIATIGAVTNTVKEWKNGKTNLR